MDMKNSTAAAERLGEVDFHRLLNRLVTDLSGPIVLRDGQIHRYVGDELIATWPLARGLRNATCVRACFAAQRGHWASSGYAARNRPSGFARWPRRRLIHASRRYEKMGTYARRPRPGQITPSQIMCFQIPGGATLGPVHKCPQFHNPGIGPLWFETAVLALPPAKALPRTG